MLLMFLYLWAVITFNIQFQLLVIRFHDVLTATKQLQHLPQILYYRLSVFPDQHQWIRSVVAVAQDWSYHH